MTAVKLNWIKREVVLNIEEVDIFEIIKDRIDANTMNDLKKAVSNLSHELKRPLSSAILSLHTLKDGYLGEVPKNQKEILESVSENLDRMSSAIDKLLDEPRRRLNKDDE